MKPLIVGVGNKSRGDDAIGLLAVDWLKATHPDLAVYKSVSGDLTTVLDHWCDTDLVIFIDAVKGGIEPGSLVVVEGEELPDMDSSQLTTSHGFSVADVVRMGQILECIPESIELIGVAGNDWEINSPMSYDLQPVLDRIEEIVLSITGESLV